VKNLWFGGSGGQPVDKLTALTPDQRRAFDFIGAAIPLTLR